MYMYFILRKQVHFILDISFSTQAWFFQVYTLYDLKDIQYNSICTALTPILVHFILVYSNVLCKV